MLEILETCNCETCTDRCYFFKNLNKAEYDRLHLDKKTYKYTKGEVIVKSGAENPFLLLLTEGYCKLVIESNFSNSFIIEVVKSAGLINMNFLSNHFHAPMSVIALSDVRICAFEINGVIEALKTNSLFGFDMLQYTNINGKKRFERLASIALKQTRGKLADTILYLSETFDSMHIDSLFSRKDLAELSNLSTENTIRTLKQFEEEGIIRSDKRALDILDMDLLHRASNMG